MNTVKEPHAGSFFMPADEKWRKLIDLFVYV